MNVIVIGHGYSIRLGVIRAVAPLGCKVTVIHVGRPIKPVDAYSKYVSDVLYINRQQGTDGLVRLLLEKCTVDGQKSVIIPTDDFSALAVDNDAVKKHFAVPHIAGADGTVVHWMDKARQKELALSVGLDTAGFAVAEKNGGKLLIPDNINYPCFTKPLLSIGAGKKCLRRCDTPEELKAVLALADKNGIPKLLIEDFIDIRHEYAVLGFSDGNSVVIPAVIQFLKESKRHRGVALSGQIMPVAGFEDLIGRFADFVRRMGFVGIFDIDFLESDGLLYFDEMNLRTGGSGTAIFKSGANLPAMFVKAMCHGGADDMTPVVTQSATFVNEKMALDDFTSGEMSLREYKRLVKASDILFIKDETDNAPYEELEKLLRDSIISYKRILKRLLHEF